MLTAVVLAFDAWAKLNGGTGKTALLIGCSAPHVSLLRQGKKRPSRQLASKIEKAGGPAMQGWDE